MEYANQEALRAEANDSDDLLFVWSNSYLVLVGNTHYNFFEYMGAIWIAWVGTCHAMGGHGCNLKGKCWALFSGMEFSAFRVFLDALDVVVVDIVIIIKISAYYDSQNSWPSVGLPVLCLPSKLWETAFKFALRVQIPFRRSSTINHAGQSHLSLL